MTARDLLPALLLAANVGAQAFSCAPTQGEECRLELSTVTIVFDSGVHTFDGDSQFIGSDGYVTGYTTGTGDFPELTLIDIDEGHRAGFAFTPPMYGQVGGSGIEGYHEASAYFNFYGLQFIAKPEYHVDGVELSVAGSRATAGNGYVALAVPGVPIFNGNDFVGSAVLDPFSEQNFGAGFTASTYNEESGDGTAAVYGTACAGLTAASLIVRVSAMPEAPSSLLWLLGSLGLFPVHRARQREAR